MSPDRPDLVAWKRRNEIRRSNAAQPLPTKRERQEKIERKHKGNHHA